MALDSRSPSASAAGRPPGLSPVPRAAQPVREEWCRITAQATPADTFDPDTLADLPEPARRWLTHSIAPGTPLWRSVELEMSGEIRLGRWRAFTAHQVLAPTTGFIWAATTRFFGLPVAGFDRFSSGSGQLRWRLIDLIPVMSAGGPDVTRSAAGRLAGEAVLVPTSFRGASWARSDTNRAVASWSVEGEWEDVELHVGPRGRLLDVLLQRWGNPNGAPYGRYPFGVTFTEEAAFDGITIPAVLSAGWWWDTERQSEGEFFRARISAATFR